VDEEMKIFLEQTVGVIFLEGGGGWIDACLILPWRVCYKKQKI
jgi:hypothetical protein